MQFSEPTISILKNFSSIQDGIVFEPGNLQRTMAPDQGILVEATFAESFPKEVAIIELSTFLQNLVAFKNPDVKFNDKNIQFIGENGAQQRSYAGIGLIKTPPDKKLDDSSATVILNITKEQIKTATDFAGINNSNKVTIQADDKNVMLIISTDDAEAPVTRIKLKDGVKGEVWSMSFRVDRFSKLMALDYEVKVVPGKFASFKNTTNNLTYFIAAEQE